MLPDMPLSSSSYSLTMRVSFQGSVDLSAAARRACCDGRASTGPATVLRDGSATHRQRGGQRALRRQRTRPSIDNHLVQDGLAVFQVRDEVQFAHLAAREREETAQKADTRQSKHGELRENLPDGTRVTLLRPFRLSVTC